MEAELQTATKHMLMILLDFRWAEQKRESS